MKKATKVVKNKKGMKQTKGAVILGAMAVGALAGFFLYGSKEASKNRQKVKGWALKAKGEVLEKVERLKEASEPEFHAVVDSVLKKYEAVRSIDTKEVKALGRDLKKHWRAFSKEISKTKKA